MPESRGRGLKVGRPRVPMVVEIDRPARRERGLERRRSKWGNAQASGPDDDPIIQWFLQQM